MDRRKVTGGRAMRAAALGLAIGAVAGCDEGQNMAFLQSKDPAGEATVTRAKSTKLVERDIESPEVFQATESGLWDGRPSLGGVWVAHPDVTEPQRVIIRNSANGKFVIGALFRRERDIPGPRIQASSDAASALGMLAGAPVELNVTALVREEIPTGPVADEQVEATPTVIADSEAAPEASGVAQSGTQEATPTVVAGDESGAPKKSGLFAGLFGKNKTSAADVEATPTVLAESEDVADDPAIAAAAAAIESAELPGDEAPAAATPTVAGDDSSDAPKRPALFAGLFGKNKQAEPGIAPADDAEAAATAAFESEPREVRPTVVPLSEDAGTPAAENGDVNARPGFLAAIFGNGRNKGGTGASSAGGTQVAAAAPAVTGAPLSAIPAASPTVAVAPLPKSSALSKPYIQIGIFSVEENANRTADQMRRAGMVPTVFEQSTSGKSFWRVVVGPAQTKSEANTLLKQVKQTGFSDAYFVTN